MYTYIYMYFAFPYYLFVCMFVPNYLYLFIDFSARSSRIFFSMKSARSIRSVHLVSWMFDGLFEFTQFSQSSQNIFCSQRLPEPNSRHASACFACRDFCSTCLSLPLYACTACHFRMTSFSSFVGRPYSIQ
jgi:hypothetical protein